MCSVVGFISKNKAKDSIDQLKTMMYYLHHRGPDENNLFLSDDVLLGNTRLSILDTENHMTQPFSFKGIYVVFNGEIYNYKTLEAELKDKYNISFNSTCDTEVIPYLYYFYGASFVDKLDGQFSIVLYDKNINKVFLYRDRLGKKPLYYYKSDQSIYIASEMRSIRSVKDSELNESEIVNIASLWSYDNSFYKNITSVKEGTYLEIDIDSLNILEKEYFSLYSLVLSDKIQVSNKEEAKDIIKESLSKAVKKRLLSDVGYGLYLSGGLDSTILASLLVKENKDIETYSVVFPEAGSFNEQEHQKNVADYYGIKNRSVEVLKDDLYNSFEEYVLFSDSILFRTAPIPMSILSKVASKQEKVIFSGEGSDELFFGYDIFKEVKYSKLMSSKSSQVRDHFMKKLYPYMLNDKQSKFMQISLLGNKNNVFSSHMLRIKNLRQFNRFLKTAPSPTILDKYENELSFLSPLKRAQYLEYKTLLLNYLLSVQGDLAAMKNSIEIRAPFLDYELIQNVMSIDPKILFPLFNEKKLLKDVYMKDLPTSIVNRFKQPYRAPDATIFYGKKEVLEKISSYKKFGEFDREKVLGLTKKVIENKTISYVDSFYFLIIYSSLILMNRSFNRVSNIEINNIMEI